MFIVALTIDFVHTNTVSFVFVLLILVIGFRLTFRILPPWVGKLTLELVGFLIRLIFGTGIKGRK